MISQRELESVDLIDSLMLYFRNDSVPPDALCIEAYNHGINVQLLKEYVEGVECEDAEY